jgi:HK97 gp10 family phage protein
MAFKASSTYKSNASEVKYRGKQVVNKSSYEVGLIVEGQAKELAARKYGYLAASINTQSINNGDDVESPGKYAKETPPSGHDVSTFRKITKPTDDKECLVGTAVDYAPYQEFGTIKMPAQSFLRPAGDMAQGKVLTTVEINGKQQFKEYLK